MWPEIGKFLPWRRRALIAQLQRDLAKRDQALRTVRNHAREIELKAASFGLGRILDPRLSEIEVHALDARLVAERASGERRELAGSARWIDGAKVARHGAYDVGLRP